VNRKRTLLRIGIVVGLCAIAGAAAGIAGSAAAPSGNAKRSNSIRHVGPRWGMHGRAVHADAVVLNRAGNAFITQTEDSGKVKSVSGDKLTITEGVGNVTYKDVTLTIPSNATVVRNFSTSGLGALKAGDLVHATQSSDGTFVLAVDPSHRPAGPGHFGLRRGPRGPGGPWPPGRPPA
jgi:hypothetical protein